MHKVPCRSKYLTVVPRLALTPRTPLLKHSAQYAPPLKRIIMTVTMPRPYKTIVLSRFSSAVAHHALKSPDRLFERNSKRSRKIATTPCRAKKLEKCHVKHFPLIITQALRPYLPADTDHVKEIDTSADRAPFTIPYYRRPHATVDNPIFLTITITSGSRKQKPPRSCRNTSKFGKAIKTAGRRTQRKKATTSSTQDISPEAKQNR